MAIEINETPPAALRQIRTTFYKDDATGEIWIDRGSDGWNRIVSAAELTEAISDIDIPTGGEVDPADITAAAQSAVTTAFDARIKTMVFTAVDIPSVNGSNRYTHNLNFPGAVVGDTVIIGFFGAVSQDAIITAKVSAADVITVVLANMKTSTAYKLPIQDIKITIVR